jgi:hypothetical protein
MTTSNVRFAAVTADNYVVGVYVWAPGLPWTPPPYQPVDADGNPIGDLQPTTAIPDTDPPTAQIGFIYNPADGTFSDPTPPATQSPGLFSRILSALNPFK